MVYLILRLLRVITFSVNYLLIAENLTIDKIKKGKTSFLLINTIFFFVLISYNKKLLLIPISLLLVFTLIFTNIKKIKYALFISSLTELVFVISELIASLFICTIFNTPIQSLTENSFVNNMVTVPFFIIGFIISKILGKILNKMYKKNSIINNENTINSTVVYYSIFALINIFISIVIFSYFIEHLNRKFFIINGLTMVCNILIVLLMIYNNNKIIENRLQREYKDREIQQLQEYVDTVENLSDGLRKFKHDHINIFNAMGTYIKANDMDGLRKFYKEELLPESEKIMVNDATPYLLKNMKINSLKGVISSKIVNAHFNDIRTHIEIIDEIVKININDIDICRIIGILLDNAIEAAALCDDKSIHFAVIKNNEDTTFIIKNTCPSDVPPIHKLKENGFSTKGNNRGLGLSTVDDIINKKYTNLSLRTKVEESIFTQELTIIN